MNVLWINTKEVLIIIEGREKRFYHNEGKALELMMEIIGFDKMTFAFKYRGFRNNKCMIHLDKCVWDITLETCGMDVDILLRLFKNNLKQKEEQLEDTQIIEIAA